MFSDWRFSLATRLFSSSRDNRLVSFVGLLSVGGLVLAVAVLVTVLSVMNGFERELRERVLGVIPHGTLHARQGDYLSDWQSVRNTVLGYEGVAGAAPTVSGTGLVVAGEQLSGVTFRGIDPALEGTVSILPRFVEGTTLQVLDERRFHAILGAELAEGMGLSIGDHFSLVLPDVRFTLAGPVLTTRQLTLAGTFRVGADVDKNQVLLSYTDAARLKRQRGVDGIVVKTDDLFAAPEILLNVAAAEGLYATSWMRRHGSLYDAIQTQKATMFLLLLILVAVAAFNVVSNLVMTVDDNRAKIAILRTIGASPGDIRLTFFVHGLLVGVLGVVIGVAIGVGLTLVLSPAFEVLTNLLGLEIMGEYFIRYLPTEVLISDLAAISTTAFLICIFATIYPANKAAKALPARPLAYDV